MPAHASTSEQSANASHEAIKLTGNCSHREEMPNVSAATMSATRDTMMRVKFNETAERVFHGALLCARRSNSFAV